MSRDKIMEIAQNTTISLMNMQSKKEFKKMLDDPIMGWKVHKFLDEIYEAIQKGKSIKSKTADYPRH
jgi:hypothetical protein